MVFTSASHPETNGQTERYNRTILSRLRKFVKEHSNTWDNYVDVLTYAYNTQVYNTTRRALFDLVLSQPPPSAFHEATTRESTLVRQTNLQWLTTL